MMLTRFRKIFRVMQKPEKTGSIMNSFAWGVLS